MLKKKVAEKAAVVGAGVVFFGPIGALAFCFDEFTNIHCKENGREVLKAAKDIKVGDQVRSFSLDKSKSSDTIVSVKVIVEGEFDGKLIRFDDPKYALKVTNEHMMIHSKIDGAGKFIKPARDLVAGDI